MKGCLVVAGLFVAALAIFVGIFIWAAGRGNGDDLGLSQQADRVQVTSSRTSQIGQATNRRTVKDIEYTYEVDGRTFASSTRLPGRLGSRVDVCVDPADPAEHTVRTKANVPCGTGDLGLDGVRRAREAS